MGLDCNVYQSPLTPEQLEDYMNYLNEHSLYDEHNTL